MVDSVKKKSNLLKEKDFVHSVSEYREKSKFCFTCASHPVPWSADPDKTMPYFTASQVFPRLKSCYLLARKNSILTFGSSNSFLDSKSSKGSSRCYRPVVSASLYTSITDFQCVEFSLTWIINTPQLHCHLMETIYVALKWHDALC